ncbi:MAG: hypothetical protein ACLS4V_04875 [Oscillospiraceae bacterium]
MSPGSTGRPSAVRPLSPLSSAAKYSGRPRSPAPVPQRRTAVPTPAAALTVSHCRAGRHPPFPPKTCRLPSTRAVPAAMAGRNHRVAGSVVP